jgi:hypothetical protein
MAFVLRRVPYGHLELFDLLPAKLEKARCKLASAGSTNNASRAFRQGSGRGTRGVVFVADHPPANYTRYVDVALR